MEMSKIDGLISAIEAEAKQPHPSHANLARLVAMIFREMYGDCRPQPAPATTATSGSGSGTVETTIPPASESGEENPPQDSGSKQE